MSKRGNRRGRPRDTSSMDRAWASYSKRFREQTLPHLLSSRVVVSVHTGPPDGVAAIQAATEIGMCLLFGKPLVLFHTPGKEPPEALQRAAAVVMEWDPQDPTCQDRLHDVLVGLGIDKEDIP